MSFDAESAFDGNTMPSLADFDGELLELKLAQLVWIGPGLLLKGTLAQNFCKLYVRNVQKAIRSYERARKHLNEMGEPHPPSSLIRAENGLCASAEMEDSVGATKRAAYALDRLKRSKDTSVSVRTLRIPASQLGVLVGIRDAVEHCEEELAGGTVASDQLLMVQMRRADFQMAGHKFSLADYANILRRMHGLSVQLVERDPSVAR